jgi:hypothetical protein
MKRLITILMVFSTALLLAQQVTLVWDASPSPGVTAYRVYCGTNSGNYTFTTNTGLVRTQTVMVPHTGRWFFAATAADTNGMESQFSNEVQWEVKPLSPVMKGEAWLRLTPLIERSTNLGDGHSFAGESTWIAATNEAEFFAARRLLIEHVQKVSGP